MEGYLLYRKLGKIKERGNYEKYHFIEYIIGAYIFLKVEVICRKDIL